MHWLVRSLSQVDYGETPVAEHEPGSRVRPRASRIRTTMRQTIDHPLHFPRRDWLIGS